MQLYRAETPGPMKGLETDTADHRDCESTVVHLPEPDGIVRGGVLCRRHEFIRRDFA